MATSNDARLMAYEHRLQPPISVHAFIWRLARHGGYAGMLIVGSVVIGTTGYHWLGREPLIDSFLNACMLLGGMGPVGDLSTSAGKIFAAFFALYAGLVFLATTVIMFTPVLHRVLHKFHWDADHTGKSS
ncbi:MAG TPA: hypothetical protein VHV78_14375 [Gemmatimonadaceae bacterium]|nr:hypothetical protein [Gemmatimonadaceae bacterium]